MNIKLSSEELNIIQMFEYLTDVDCLDCYIDKEGKVIFLIVDKGQLKKAVGKNGRNTKFLEETTNMKVKISEYSNDIKEFVKNLISNVKDVVLTDNGNLIITVEKYARPFVLGRERRNLEIYKRLLSKSFNNIKEIYIK
ncbi:MAG: NusA-like transcription termination signal-binding factor [Candidatus Aenigmarchaeota archaeon]|nr:NusA-like transcription termination signal-binding factor [Candidatus Aenigmarchaeota archaeon]MDW8149151.1 NusA-like transcription termination signal-binding factor [Candidatus Aenigmarchaeota archaeon]